MGGPILLAVFLFLFAGGISYTVLKGSHTKKIVVASLTGSSLVFFVAMVFFAGCYVVYASAGR